MNILSGDDIVNDRWRKAKTQYRAYDLSESLNKEYIKSLVMGVSTKDENINKHPLSKLIKDISEELDLI
jgi:hypothetical protein